MRWEIGVGNTQANPWSVHLEYLLIGVEKHRISQTERKWKSIHYLWVNGLFAAANIPGSTAVFMHYVCTPYNVRTCTPKRSMSPHPQYVVCRQIVFWKPAQIFVCKQILSWEAAQIFAWRQYFLEKLRKYLSAGKYFLENLCKYFSGRQILSGKPAQKIVWIQILFWEAAQIFVCRHLLSWQPVQILVWPANTRLRSCSNICLEVNTALEQIHPTIICICYGYLYRVWNNYN